MPDQIKTPGRNLFKMTFRKRGPTWMGAVFLLFNVFTANESKMQMNEAGGSREPPPSPSGEQRGTTSIQKQGGRTFLKGSERDCVVVPLFPVPVVVVVVVVNDGGAEVEKLGNAIPPCTDPRSKVHRERRQRM